jgi:AAA domain-containing protein
VSDLRVPAGWAQEYCQVTEPELFRPSAAESTEIGLACLPTQRWLADYDADEVCADLADGVVVQQRGTGAEPYFRLGGTRFDVFVQPRVEADRGVTQAFVSSVKPARGQGRTESVRPRSVRVRPVWEAPEEDLVRLAGVFAEGARIIRRRRVLLEHARRGLTTTRTPADQHSALHAAVRRHYQPLQLMLRLLEQRSTVEGTVRATGTAAQTLPGDDGPQLWIELADRTRFAEGRPVGVTMPGGTNRRLRVLEIDGHTMVVAAPREPVEEGTPLRLEQQGRFALSKHSAALRAFLDEQVEGSWTHLAQLLCRPSRLPVVDLPALARFHDADLNAEQRGAVRGAVGSPHAFFVQGPPGTGKTTVIAEVVRQLLARGERVLLLAPMHVAVDEVLGRVAGRPGVLALRISWDDARVHPDLHKYLPEQAARTYLRQARRPETSRAARWQGEITALSRQADAMTTYLGARAHRARAADLITQAEQRYRQWAAQAAAAITAADRDVATGAAALYRLEAASAQAAAHAEALRTRAAAVPWLRRVWADLRGGLGLTSDVAALNTAAREAAAHRTRLLADQRAWIAWHADAQRRAGDARGHHTSLEPVYRTDLERHRAALISAEHDLEATAADVRTVTGRDPATVGDGELAGARDDAVGEITRRRHWIALEARWFAMSGPAGRTEQTLLEQIDADLRRSANLICCTTTGVNRDLGDSDFDTLIVDEASRVIDSEFLIGAVRARRWVLVGDERQLPPYVEPADEHHLHALSALRALDRGAAPDLPTAVRRLGQRWQEDEEIHQFRARTVAETATRIRDSGRWRHTYRATFEESWTQLRRLGGEPEATLLSAMLDHLVRSLFERTVTEVPAALRQPLLWQRRMIEPIAELVRVPIYGGEYRTPPGSPLEPLRYGPTKTPIVFVDTSAHGPRAASRHVGNGFVNDLEAELVVKLCRGWERRLRSSKAEPVTVSVLTFYRAQAAVLRKALGGPRYPEFRLLRFRVVDAIDKIQGQEADLVFLSFCRTLPGRGTPSAQYGRWLQDVRRLNVACTRARRGLTIVGHAPTLRRLNGVPAAQEFYRNLFQQAVDRPADMRIVSDVG